MTPLGLSALSPYVFTRAVLPGVFLFLVFLLFEFAGILPFEDPRSLASLAMLPLFCVIGFLFDTIGAYKLHPVYRGVRRKFFANLYLTQKQEVAQDEPSRIRIAEHHREDLLYSLAPLRQKNMQLEHALWVALYNVSILSLLLGIISACAYLAKGALLIQYLVGALALLALSIITLFSARARNQSYNDKLLHLAREKKDSRASVHTSRRKARPNAI